MGSSRLIPVKQAMIVLFISLIIRLILALLSLLAGENTGEGGEGSGSVLDILPTDESKGSIILEILTYVLYAITAIVVAFLLFILIKKIMSAIKRLFKYLLGNINRKKTETFFVDIVETKNIFDVAKNKIFSGIKEYIDETGERFRAKSKREEIRYITKQKIRKLIKAGYVFDSSKTVNEIFVSKENKREVLINKELADAYDKARYSSESIEDVDLEKIK